MRSDDISGLFLPTPKGPAQAATFRVGTLAAFDPNDGSNTVVIGTSELVNLPMLVTGAEFGLEVGDIVSVRWMGNSAMIEGKIATVGGSNFGSSRTGNNSGLTQPAAGGFGITGGFVDNFVCTNGDDVAPGWARSMMIYAVGQASLHNTSGSLDNIQSSVSMTTSLSLAFGVPISTAVANTQIGSTISNINGLFACVPGQPVTFKYSVKTGNTWPLDSAAVAEMWHTITFFREELS